MPYIFFNLTQINYTGNNSTKTQKTFKNIYILDHNIFNLELKIKIYGLGYNQIVIFRIDGIENGDSLGAEDSGKSEFWPFVLKDATVARIDSREYNRS